MSTTLRAAQHETGLSHHQEQRSSGSAPQTATVVLNDVRSIIRSVLLGDATVTSYLVPENKENVWVIQGPGKNPVIKVHYQVDSQLVANEDVGHVVTVAALGGDDDGGERNCPAETILGLVSPDDVADDREVEESDLKEKLTCQEADVASISCQQSSNVTEVEQGDIPAPESLGEAEHSSDAAELESISIQTEQELPPSFFAAEGEHFVVECDVPDNYIVVFRDSSAEFAQETALAPIIPMVEHAYAINPEATQEIILDSSNLIIADTAGGQLTASSWIAGNNEVRSVVQSVGDAEICSDASVGIAIEDCSVVQQIDVSTMEIVPATIRLQQSGAATSAGRAKPRSVKCRYCGVAFQNSAVRMVHEKRRDCKQVGEDHVERDFRLVSCKTELQDDVIIETTVQKRNRTQRTKLTHAEQNVPRQLSTGKRSQCSFCEKTFSTMTNQKIHERTHTGERPYKCTYCEKTFYIVSHKKRHEITHTGVRPHQCSFCEKTFSTIANQKRHERTHTKEKPYPCSHCDKTFAQIDSLKAHERTHTGEKPYHCAHCDKTFSQYCSKVLHERIHNGKKPYQCSHCDKKFAHSSQKKLHEKLHAVTVN